MTFVSTLGQALDNVERIKITQLQLATLQQQVATGKKTNEFKGLGTDVLFSKRARADFAKLDTYVGNIDTADRRLKLMVGALTEIKNQATDVLNSLEIQTQQGEYEIEAVSNLARNTANFLRDLVNTRDGDRYLFGGSETLNPPLSDSGTLETYMITQLNDWVGTTIDTDELIASYQDGTQLTDTIIGYSAPLSGGTVKNVTVRVEDNSEIDYTVFANFDGLRDIIAGVNMIGQIDQVIDEVTLNPDAPTPPPGSTVPPGTTNQERNNNFYQFFNDLAAMLNVALDKVDTEIYKLSQSQAQIDTIRKDHELDKNLLQDTISEVEDADMNEVALKLNVLQLQLEASYRVTATVSQLSLANFIG